MSLSPAGGVALGPSAGGWPSVAAPLHAQGEEASSLRGEGSDARTEGIEPEGEVVASAAEAQSTASGLRRSGLEAR